MNDYGWFDADSISSLVSTSREDLDKFNSLSFERDTSEDVDLKIEKITIPRDGNKPATNFITISSREPPKQRPGVKLKKKLESDMRKARRIAQRVKRLRSN